MSIDTIERDIIISVFGNEKANELFEFINEQNRKFRYSLIVYIILVIYFVITIPWALHVTGKVLGWI